MTADFVATPAPDLLMVVVCSACRTAKPAGAFGLDRRSKHGRNGVCKECRCTNALLGRRSGRWKTYIKIADRPKAEDVDFVA